MHKKFTENGAILNKNKYWRKMTMIVISIFFLQSMCNTLLILWWFFKKNSVYSMGPQIQTGWCNDHSQFQVLNQNKQSIPHHCWVRLIVNKQTKHELQKIIKGKMTMRKMIMIIISAFFLQSNVQYIIINFIMVY